MNDFRYVVADVFTDTPLEGNQVAVFTDARGIPDDKLQQIAREMNLSETVFVYKPEDEGHARIRIFTPTTELPFAGHPTLGTAFVLSGPLSLEEIRLETLRGIVPVRLEREEGTDRVRADGPTPADRGGRTRTTPSSSTFGRRRLRSCRSSSTTTAFATCTSASGPRTRWRR